MYVSKIIFVILSVHQIRPDWVEITQVRDKELTFTERPTQETTSTIQKPTILATTPASYEFIMKTPFYDFQTTTANPNISTFSKRHGFIAVTSPSPDNVIPRSTTKYTFPKPKLKNPPTTEAYDENFTISIEDEDDSNFTSFIPVIQSIQKTLLKNKDGTVMSKIAMLKNLRDTLLLNIGDKMLKLWSPKENRQARSHKDDGHMDFPSNEGALMTIGFLTFAVFLIKLVLKLIYALKYKQQYYYTTTTTAATLFIRKQRDVDEDENLRILRLIEEFKLD